MNTIGAAGMSRAILPCLCLWSPMAGQADQMTALPEAIINGNGAGWRVLGERDFVHVNCQPERWSWIDEMIHCTGNPNGVIGTKKVYTNFERVAQCRHVQSGGNSGMSIWPSPASLQTC